jgi:predicted Rossmann-fold nucleotide-binding protein
LTLRQTGRMQDIPIIMFGREYWQKAINFTFLADAGTIEDADLDLISFAETADEAWNAIQEFHRRKRACEGQTDTISDTWATH